MATYGDKEDPLVSEQTLATPKSFYAIGKLASENYMRIYSQMFGIKCTALRIFNVFGAGYDKHLFGSCIEKHHIAIKGSGDRFRDFVYKNDIVDAVLRLMS